MTFEFSLARLTQIAELLKFSDLKDEVEHSEIRASDTSDALPVNECEHLIGTDIPYNGWPGYQIWLTFTYCPKCGEKL